MARMWLVRLRTNCRWQDGARGENAQAQQVREMPGIRFIAGVLEAVVLADGSGVGQFDVEPGFLQAVDQPVPVVGRFDDHAGQLPLPWLEKPDDLFQVVREPLFRDDLVAVIRYRYHAVVRVQVNSAIFHLRPPVVKQVRKLTLTPPPHGGGRPAR